MATENQKTYISDLVVLKTKEFKEVKELLISKGIVSDNAEIVGNAQSLSEITGALTDLQASQFIDVLIATEAPKRDTVYSASRVSKAMDAMDSILDDIDKWDFETV